MWALMQTMILRNVKHAILFAALALDLIMEIAHHAKVDYQSTYMMEPAKTIAHLAIMLLAQLVNYAVIKFNLSFFFIFWIKN